ncbi:hypothetical protein QQS21_010131 [Conoideocrella luteorostrata]|uniref:Uncharacterized protein n=1 Tax=Conoideocrella luteorostrata TaxID=1105319 RepID=A0AAJ0CFS7_9HYPO|nr:hypothetical protein QQS21_010131 [Conoideocrella luteorostrata]
MAPAGLPIIFAGSLAALATSTTICLEIISCINAEGSSSLIAACSAAAALESTALLILGALGIVDTLHTGIPSSWYSTKLAFILQLFACIAAAAASIVALAFLQQSTSETQGGGSIDIRRNLLVGLAIALALAAILQFGFITFHFLTNRDITLGSTSSSLHPDEDRRNVHVKGIRYSQTHPIHQIQEMTSVSSIDSVVPSEKTSMGPIDLLRSSVSQAIRPTSSRTRLLGSERRPRLSLDSIPTRTSAETSFDCWDTSSVDAHNRQVVMDMSFPSALKKALETIPASPSESVAPSRSDTPVDAEYLEPPRVLQRMESYSSSLHSQQESNRLTPSSSANELHIHPLFRSDSPTPPPAATPGTVVLAAPNAGQVISRRGSHQSLQRLRSGSLPVGRSPLTHYASSESIQPQRKMKDDGDVGRSTSGARGERKMTPPVPEWLLSPSMKASLESFKEQDDDGEAETRQ